jgi:Glycosyltransferase family 92
VRFVAQNKRRCETGAGKDGIMKHWEPQTSLFQGVPVRRDVVGRDVFRLWPDAATADAAETRFLCRFHSSEETASETTLSQFDFNYEYVLWRKDKLPMFKTTGKDVSTFELSQLLFSCPIPARFQSALSSDQSNRERIFLDLVPIRTPARVKPLLTFNHTGSTTKSLFTSSLFDPQTTFGNNHVLPPIQDSGRWANLALCPAAKKQPQRTLVACTWTSANYNRRGDAAKIHDAARRLREWVLFHKIVGFEHFYVYDNTELVADNLQTSPLEAIAVSLGADLVTYHRWPARVCNNNRPNHSNPGERSSQYAAEASCRVRYGSSTTWMAFLDTDEYMVPANHTRWHNVLATKANFDVLKMRSSRGRPRLKFMVPLDGCEIADRKKAKLATDSCLVQSANATFLRVYKYVARSRLQQRGHMVASAQKHYGSLSHTPIIFAAVIISGHHVRTDSIEP